MSFVAVDIGASNTRYVSDTGKLGVLPNNMVFLDKDKFVDQEPHDGTIESALEVIIEKEGASDIYPIKLLVGQMANRYSSVHERPSGLSNKHQQRINYYSAVLATAISKIAYNLEDNIDLLVALPPIEVQSAKDLVKSKLVGRYTVRFPKYQGGLAVTFNIADVVCKEESFLAILSYFFEMDGRQRATSAKYSTGNILSIDIGASTTDLAIVQNGRYLEKSGQTYKIGGNIARDMLRDAIRRDYGFDMPISDGEVSMAEGRLQLGNTYQDVSDLVAESKKEFAAAVVNEMQGYFRKVNIPIQMIRAIVVSGGGSMQSQYINENSETVITSQPMSAYITEALNDICSNVAVEPYGDNPRFANIAGLFITAKMLAMRKKNIQQAQPVQQVQQVQPVQQVVQPVQQVNPAQDTIQI